MNKHLSLLIVVVIIFSCETVKYRYIVNETKHDVALVLQHKFLINNHTALDTILIEKHNKHSASNIGHPPFFFNKYGGSIDKIDSLIIEFKQQDTIKEINFMPKDTSKLYLCLTSHSPQTCVIEERHLKRAKLIAPKDTMP